MTRSQTRVRAARPEDLTRLVELAETDDLSAAVTAVRFSAGHDGHLQDRFAALLAANACAVFVAIDDSSGDIAGMIVLDDSDAGIVLPVPVLVISYLLVDKAYRRRGTGRALLSMALHVAEQRGVDHVVASAIAASRDGNRYLARLGFAPLVVRRIAPTSVLRRSLGMADVPDRLAVMRRVRSGGRVARPTALTRGVRRGA
jgi:ribosomal protein S18 acetylase RimI-like enzyme